jgi:hypothetical protein
MKPEELTPEELRLAIIKAKGIITGTAQTHDFRHGYGPVRMINLPDGKDIPNWPADIAAAWELVEEIIADGRQVLLYCDRYNYVCKILEHRFGGKMLFVSEADTAPLAICRAWLAWKESDNEPK